MDFLIGEYEDQWTEFKLDAYHRPEGGIPAIYKDITAMANAGGGDIFIGVQEEAGRAQDFVDVANSHALVETIETVCRTNIDPSINGLEVKSHLFEWKGKDITLVIIHIPPSDSSPHGFIWLDTISFVKRHGAEVRAYSWLELSADFSSE